MQVNGIPDSDIQLPEEITSVVVALKSRTDETRQAVADSTTHCNGCKSRERSNSISSIVPPSIPPQGNIGPICDAALQHMNVSYTLLCPSLPVNGRTVKDGCLSVNGVRLEQSHMKDHPLPPMWDSFIPSLMRDQSEFPCIVVSREQMDNGSIHHIIKENTSHYNHFYLIPDYEDERDARKIRSVFGHIPC